ncbi:2,3-bisphosphoglycerate-dependent phosphoglycerate mutase [Simkania negevensis]|uniref:2,3-bisphosphoglycerate-dependent phosphoglycerate mutase n=1 Tax=Simkania negevensis TaxID=83561 RepID=A0ABS3APG4_9BACT|nr:2,3-bisphosphoglycerate-dependent phosphoglycerate mutase [Simkania negevensis]
MTKLILMRHGQSLWNQLNLFTGWVDIPLSHQGIHEALEGGRKIKDIPIDIVFTSTLVRAQMTAYLVMSQHHSGKVAVVKHDDEAQLADWGKIYSSKTEGKTIPVYYVWQFNERYYGELQGLNKSETAEKYGHEQVHIWRRSYDIAPPGGESLEMTAARTIPYFEETVVPMLERGKNVFISAHGNSLRSIVMDLEGLSKEEVLQLEIPTGAPLIFNYEQGSFTREEL